jgi:hypothetical protein
MAQPEPTEAELNEGTSDAKTSSSKASSEPKGKSSSNGSHIPAVLKRSPDSSQKLIVASIAIATANTVFANMRKEDSKVPAPRIVIGGFAVAIGLLFLSELQSEFAEAMALVILVASLVGPNGTELVNAVTNLTSSDKRVKDIGAKRPVRGSGGVHYS